jgi:phosphoribosylformylglycinamidine cyclo-ligase
VSNSGIMSNGHTLARTSLLSENYLDKYPEISHSSRGRYNGRFKLDDKPEGLGISVGEALLSPTRLYAPVASAVLREVGGGVHGMVHNTGGGQTKCLRVGRGLKYVKDSLPESDPVFHLIQREAGVEWREMYQDFNMGVGFEFILDPASVEAANRAVERFGIGVQVIGRCEKGGEKNTLEINSKFGRFLYD